jgi:hypothetical protein
LIDLLDYFGTVSARPKLFKHIERTTPDIAVQVSLGSNLAGPNYNNTFVMGTVFINIERQGGTTRQ